MWSNKDGTKREKFIYVCGHYKRTGVGGSCNRNGIACEVIEEEVLNYTKKLLNNEEFASDVKSKIGNSIDSSEMDNEIQRIKKELSLVEKRKKNLENDIDNILNEDKHSKRKRMDFQR